MKTRPPGLTPADMDMSNFDCVIPDGLSELLQEEGVYSTHPARDHYGYIWWEDDFFYEEVWIYGTHVATISAITLSELMDYVNDEFGWD